MSFPSWSRMAGASALLALACNVEEPADGTGGVPDGGGGACPAGVSVVLSDYVSTQVALSGLDGRTLSASFISTASTAASGVAFALSGDVALPSARPPSGEVVLLDRFGTNVITWVSPATAAVRAQLPVGTGFEANPQDYLELPDGRAYVARWGENTAPGAEPFDAGSDVLVIDRTAPAVLGRIALPREGDLPPRPAVLGWLGETVVVALQRISLDFSTTGSALLVGIDPATDAVVWQQAFPDLTDCGVPVASPSGGEWAMACSGPLGPDGGTADLARSALLIVDWDGATLTELRRFPAAGFGPDALQHDVTWASDGALLLRTQTGWGAATHNRWLAVDAASGAATELLVARADDTGAGKGMVYGAPFCAPGCSTTCLLPDADRGVLQTATVSEDGVVALGEPVTVEATVGLPPQRVGGR